MELLSKFLEEIASNTKSEIEEISLIVLDKSAHEQKLYQFKVIKKSSKSLPHS